ncbi:hypothetical protein [Priestia taiwanensis]|uniref:Uncharacterized protein n=1 Tax=Priestia taiwanensis TaxID=1347902 RepID=A0A917AP08_9BACI|nr:hypothetical protein [Priestia taiwanensis]MBM7362513.1 putative metalloprotease with PDZ domain [Priestia taiwanensis]GGE62812.1 hypothetical protein GCM10007140_11370 [Priestia taiwanensis]
MREMCYVFMLSVLLFSFSAMAHAEESTKSIDNKLYTQIEAALKKKNSFYAEGSLVVLDSITVEKTEGLFIQYTSIRDNFFKKYHKATIFYDTEKDAIVQSVKGKEGSEFVMKYKDEVGVEMSHMPILLMLAGVGFLLYFALYTTTSRSTFVPE